MHRALIIQLGEALQADIDRLAREYDLRAQSGALCDVRLAFVDAPPQGVGNLTHPVAILRENLERELLTKVTELLSLTVGESGELLLDVFVVVNLGEPLVANATMVVVEMLVTLIESQYQAIFPPHRVGAHRRFRVVPIALLPAAGDCKKDRNAAVEELRSLHDIFAKRQAESAEFPVDRFFLLDAVTGRGVATLADLSAQVGNFLRLVLLGGVRRAPEFVQLLEAECNDLFGTFGIAAAEVDFEILRDVLTARMAARTAAALAEDGGCELPTVQELIPASVFDDRSCFDRAAAELDALPQRTLEVEGSRALRSLEDLYAELLERVDTLRAETEHSAPAASKDSDAGRTAPLVPALLSGAVLGGAVFAVGQFALLLTTAASVATGGGFALAAFAAVMFVSSGAGTAEPEFSALESEHPEEESSARRELLRGIVEAKRGELRAANTTLSGLSRAVSVVEEAPQAAPDTVSAFRAPLVSDELMQLLYDRQISDDDVRDFADRFVVDSGGWEGILSGSTTVSAADLEQFCRARFATLGGQPLFADTESRFATIDTLRRHLETWRHGMPNFLEGESRKQFDPDGFRHVFASTVLVPAELGADVSLLLRELGGTLTSATFGSCLDDVFVISAVVNIHPDAVTPLATATVRLK